MTVKIIFETQTGTTQYVAEVIQKVFQQSDYTVELHSVKYKGMQPDLSGVDVVIFGAPTYDDGYLEKNMKECIDQFHPDLSHLKVAVFGLGNSAYPQFCTAADFLEEWVKKQQGNLVVPLLRVDGFPDDTTAIEDWTKTIISQL